MEKKLKIPKRTKKYNAAKTLSRNKGDNQTNFPTETISEQQDIPDEGNDKRGPLDLQNDVASIEANEKPIRDKKAA